MGHSIARPQERAGCHHCGLAIAAAAPLRFASADGARQFCCAGCEAVSHAISGLGLDDYYRLRTATGPRAPGETDPAAFDHPAVRARFVTEGADGIAEARLLIEGMHCAACAWLVEQAISRQPGVRSVEVHYATRRARVRWDRERAQASAFFRAVSAIGYVAWPFEEGRVALVEERERRALLRRLWVAGLGMMQVMMYAVPAYIAADGELGADAASLMRWAGLILTLPVVLYSAAPMFAGAVRDLRVRRPGMDVPIALGLAVAFAGSAWNTVAGSGEVYFDSVTMFVFLLLGARYLELLARVRAGNDLLRLARLVPRNAHRLRGTDGLESDEVPAAALEPGERILVRPGETLPADGELESACATLDEAWMSGESRPVPHVGGDMVLGGAVNAGSALVVRVRRTGEASAICAIQRLMERALAQRPRWAASAERAVPYFVACVLGAAALAWLAWLAIDPARAPWIAVSVLIVTCPCALALAAPAAVTVAAGALAGNRVVVARLDAIESLAEVTDVVFDKTGTLTAGRPRLVEVFPLGTDGKEVALAKAAALALGSAHPLDAALLEASAAARPPATGHASTPGQGIEAILDARRVRLGGAAFAGALHGRPRPLGFIDGQDPTAWLADEAGWIAAFRFADLAREESARSVKALERLGLAVHMLSGDSRPVVERLSAELGITHAAAAATPRDKMDYVRALQGAGARVAMVGDGINDGPVLAQSDVSLAMGSGADVAKVRADFVLLSDSPADVVAGIAIARKARRVVRQNLGWALGYNAVAIPVALLGLVTPLAAGIGMAASSLAVVANALRARA